MTKRNGYFQLHLEEEGTYIRLFPQQDGGMPIDLSEVMSYLNDVKIYEYDLETLTKTLRMLSSPVTIKLMEKKISPVAAYVQVQIAKDRMTAAVRLYPPSNHGAPLSQEMILGSLTRAKVGYGIVEPIINRIVSTPIYCQTIPVAKGKAAVEGSDAVIEYLFDTNPLAKPKMNEDGSVDFHQLNIFTEVKEGQLLATLTPEKEGIPGMDVFGNPLNPHKIRKKTLKYGKNIRISDDKLQIFSEVSGDVKLEGDMVFVSNSYTVAADIDASTGDIVYEGNVIVNGNVRTGFSIHAKGDIQVKGVVEGASLYAGGNIVLSRGIQGMNRGLLFAEGDVLTKFIESATVKAGGTVRSGSILHSTVEAGDKILCEGRKSFAIGGTLSAGNLIQVKTIGNQMGTETNVKIGVDPLVYEQLKDAQKELTENQDMIEKCIQVLVLFKKRMESGQGIPQDKIPIIKKAGEDRAQLEERQTELKLIIENATKAIEANANGRLKVSDAIYSGVRIQISNSMYVVKDTGKYCQFYLEDGEIVMSGC